MLKFILDWVASFIKINFTFFFFNSVWLLGNSGLPWWLIRKGSACQHRDEGLIPGSGRSPGEGNGTLLQCSCLGSCHGHSSLAGYSSWDHNTVQHDLATKQQLDNLNLLFEFVSPVIAQLNSNILGRTELRYFQDCGYTQMGNGISRNIIISLNVK